MKTNKGITLIALVITIIILIILAAIAINAVFGENGLITKANQAKTDTTKAGVKEELEQILADFFIEKYTKQKNLEDYLTEKSISYTSLGTENYSITYKGFEFIVNKNGNITDVVTQENNVVPENWEGTIDRMVDGVPIPTHYYYVTGSKNTGVVISDYYLDEDKGDVAPGALQGNQFVWIPAPSGNIESVSHEPELGYDFIDDTHSVDLTNSINEYKGFYIARYDASLDSLNLVSQSKGGKEPLRNITYQTAKDYAEGEYNQDYVVKSLPTGFQWDKVVSFVAGPSDTKTWGNYYNDTFSSTTDIGLTAQWEETKRKNIYDVAGNIMKFTTEKQYKAGDLEDDKVIVVREGSYNYNASPAGAVNLFAKVSESSTTMPFVGFRTAMYIIMP